MKKVLLSMGVVATLAMTSCGGGDPADIKVEELTDACGCLDATISVYDGMIELSGEFENPEDMDEAAMDKYKALEEKRSEIKKHCMDELKLKPEDMKDCDGYDDLEKKMKELH